MLETLLILLVFVAALAYLGNMARKAFSQNEAGCPKGCGSCAAATDFEKRKEVPSRELV